ncbi:DNA distortion polypeptide 1, partial [Salmonella enterica subsp. enterica serovar Enteritidis]|nr:DNA distortion polypeptide 1 [Salmonella enterica subsp. enterica serovar Enteritidis]EKO0948023.1 DNA distortion polypeptide 1 [Escherichia coli]
MKKVQFRIDENQHDDLLDCLKTLYPDEPALTVAKGMKLLANALLKSKAVSKDINTFFDNNDFIKTTMYLTGKQRADIERAA